MKIEDHEQHWNDSSKAPQDLFGWPLVFSWAIILLVAYGAS